MGDASVLPVWLNLIWMSLSAITLIGALIWTLLIFWPYLKVTKAMQIESLNLGKESNDALQKMQEEFVPVLRDLEDSIVNIKDVIHDVKAGEGKVGDALKKAVADGRKTFRDGESELETWVFKKVDEFLGDVFGNESQEEEEEEEDSQVGGKTEYDSVVAEVRDKLIRG